MIAADLKPLVDFLKEWSALAVALIALMAIMGGKTPMGAIARWRDSVLRAIFHPFLAGARAEGAIKEVLAELRENGGSSLKDAVVRIEERQVRLGGRVDLVMLALDDAAAVYETGPDGHCVWASPAYQRIVGRTLEELHGWGWTIVLHQDDADRVRQEWRLVIEERRSFAMHFRMVHSNGHTFRVYSTANPLMMGAKVIGWSGLVTLEGAAG